MWCRNERVHTLGLCYICVRFILDLQQVCVRFMLDLCQVCVRFVVGLCQTCGRFVLDMCQVCGSQFCVRFVVGLCQICQVCQNCVRFVLGLCLSGGICVLLALSLFNPLYVCGGQKHIVLHLFVVRLARSVPSAGLFHMTARSLTEGVTLVFTILNTLAYTCVCHHVHTRRLSFLSVPSLTCLGFLVSLRRMFILVDPPKPSI